jgi:tetratricopeptide (TPR) repeat protein
VGQFGKATEILHSGLRDNSIESEQRNWELLASSYQQVDKPFQAIEALTEGAKHFPKSGQLDYQIAMIYYGLNKSEDAYKHLQTATTKGNLDKPGSVYGFMAYVCWELGKFPEAKVAVEKALTYPDAQKDTQLPKLKQAIEDAIREHEAAKANAKSL